jgi:thiosulfate/3-mercaptopyruvate sulfurtransferase
LADDISISAKEAKELLGKPGVVFVSGDNDDVFKLNHVEGSMNMDAHHLHHSDITGHLHCAPLYMCIDEAEKFIGSKGIDNDTLVVAYDDFKGPNASGVWHFFKSFGHNKVKIVNGGIAQLKNEGVKIVKGAEPKVAQKTFKIDPKKINYDIIASKEDVLKAVQDIEKNGSSSQYMIIDTRRIEEIIGSSKLDNVARGGHIPNSKFMEWTNFSDATKKLSYKTEDEMKAALEKFGISRDKTIYTYCHVGAGRGSYIATVLEKLGYKNVKVYTGSWDEWGNDCIASFSIIFYFVTEIIQFAVFFLVNNFFITESCQCFWVPVYHAYTAIDQTFVVKVYEYFDDTFATFFVHGECCTVPIAGCT